MAYVQGRDFVPCPGVLRDRRRYSAVRDKIPSLPHVPRLLCNKTASGTGLRFSKACEVIQWAERVHGK